MEVLLAYAKLNRVKFYIAQNYVTLFIIIRNIYSRLIQSKLYCGVRISKVSFHFEKWHYQNFIISSNSRHSFRFQSED